MRWTFTAADPNVSRSSLPGNRKSTIRARPAGVQHIICGGDDARAGAVIVNASFIGPEIQKAVVQVITRGVHGSDKATFVLNGEVVLETFNFTQKNEAGEKFPLQKGRIGLQAEWAELLYRNLRIKELPNQPEE